MKQIAWGVLLLAGCSAQGNQEQPKDTPAEIPVISLERRDTILAHSYVADIQALQNIEIRARVQGYIDRILVDEGQAVRKGQLLFKLSDKSYRIALSKAAAELASARSAVKIAEVELERIRTLVEKKVISPSESTLGTARLSEAKARVDAALAVIDDAEHKLSFTSIHAPFDGVIDRLPLKTGSLVSDGTLLTTLSDNQEVYAYFDISENEYLQYLRTSGQGKLGQNQTATLILSDGTRYPFPGRIETHEAEFSDNTGSIAFRARFPNRNHLLKHGASGKVQLTSGLSQVLLVPQQAVFEIQDKNYVFVVGKDSVVHLKSFKPRMRIATSLVVAEGLEAGDHIVYEGVQNLKDGSRISPVLTRPATTVAATR